MKIKCKDGQMPDGPICPACGNERGPSGVDGGSWVHFSRCDKEEKLTCDNCGGEWDGVERPDPIAAFVHGIDETNELCEKCTKPIGY